VPRKPLGPDTKPTPADLAILDLVIKYTDAHGRTPSIRALQAQLKQKGHGPAQRHVNALVAAGKLKKDASGGIVIPKRRSSGPFLAEVCGQKESEWIAAPAAALVAWRADRPSGAFHSGDIVFADPNYPAQPNDVALLRDVIGDPATTGRVEYSVRSLTGLEVLPRKRGQSSDWVLLPRTKRWTDPLHAAPTFRSRATTQWLKGADAAMPRPAFPPKLQCSSDSLCVAPLDQFGLNKVRRSGQRDS
jgi:hypothetical protein